MHKLTVPSPTACHCRETVPFCILTSLLGSKRLCVAASIVSFPITHVLVGNC